MEHIIDEIAGRNTISVTARDNTPSIVYTTEQYYTVIGNLVHMHDGNQNWKLSIASMNTDF